ncbi:acetate/propionate family kinase [uncultured Roseibium sp.]|uniref:acetate/propionate family kinase n=1 Tax=uncultured Roseibium sp. TaxID=1936171 RepID=UPI0026271B69|nr:acetate/propionate family kinase [uncultured Roseibium sp.]
MGDILVLNSGSSSIKFVLFGADFTKKLRGSAVEIGGASALIVGDQQDEIPLPDHVTALDEIFRALNRHGIEFASLTAAAHRVVHGGRNLKESRRVSDEVLAEIKRCIPLAPLHNPHNLAAIHAVAELAPDLPQCVSFDTAFHATNPEVALRYALPDSEDEKGLRRFGFHGTSYESLSLSLPEISGQPLPKRLLALHLGNGASLCAIRNGKSVATTMGYSPLEGLTMGTRTGSIDANLVLAMASDLGIDRTSQILNKESGLLGLSGSSDMRKLQSLGTERAQFAVEHFCYWAARHAGSMIAAMGGLDGIAFTGGIGENDAKVRANILEKLSWLGVRADEAANLQGSAKLHKDGSKVTAWIVEAEEERMIAHHAQKIMSAA